MLSLGYELERMARDHLHDTDSARNENHAQSYPKGHQGGKYKLLAKSDDDQFTKDLDALIVKAENYLKKKLI